MRSINKIGLAGLVLSALIGVGASFGAAASHTTRTNSGGGVIVKVTPLDLKASGDLRFEVVLDTHSVDLDAYDLKRLIVLRDGAANVYHPTSVESKGSGHHRTPTVSFASPSNGNKNIELVIKGIAGVKERIFQWQLE
jgi:hypothetical protein